MPESFVFETVVFIGVTMLHHKVIFDVSFQVKMRILMGTYALSAGYYDAYYKRAQQVTAELPVQCLCVQLFYCLLCNSMHQK